MNTEIDYGKALEMVLECKTLDVFKYNGVIYLGDRVAVVKQYLEEGVEEDFGYWLFRNIPKAIPIV